MWQKILSISLVVVLIGTAVWYFSQEQKECCLCSNFRYHAPCLIDLETGKMIELDLYFPHETKAAELADLQPQMGTFSFVSLGDVKGTKQTDSKAIELDVPRSDKTANPALCQNCKNQLGGLVISRYVLADLYDSENKNIIPIHDDLLLDLRCYHISAQKEEDVLKVVIQGTLE